MRQSTSPTQLTSGSLELIVTEISEEEIFALGSETSSFTDLALDLGVFLPRNFKSVPPIYGMLPVSILDLRDESVELYSVTNNSSQSKQNNTNVYLWARRKNPQNT